MKRGVISGLFLLMTLALFSSFASAGDVVYTLWEDEQRRFWVTIQNDTDNTILVEDIFIVFYNEKDKPIEQRQAPCKGNCKMVPHDKRDFGPHDAPANTESARVRNVKFRIQ